ncbi:MAG: hypothetical protein ACUVRM_04095, partial [Bacillota bacterium]
MTRRRLFLTPLVLFLSFMSIIAYTPMKETIKFIGWTEDLEYGYLLIAFPQPPSCPPNRYL